MNTERDYTPQIFTALGITSETQPWAYKEWCDGDSKLERIGLEAPTYYKPISLLDGTIESDGLAASLWLWYRQIQQAKIKFPQMHIWACHDFYWVVSIQKYNTHQNKSLARAVHDALVEALNINKEGEIKND